MTTAALSTATLSRFQADIDRLCRSGLDGRTLLP